MWILRSAIKRAEKKHGGTVNEDLLRALVEKINDKRERMEHWEAVRFSLNELGLCDDKRTRDKKRTRYSSAAGSYFGIRSGQARSARARQGKKTPLRKKKAPATGSVLQESSGQYAFRI